MAAPILWTSGKNAFFLQENLHVHKIPRLGGGILGLGGGGGEVPILFLWARGFFLIETFHSSKFCITPGAVVAWLYGRYVEPSCGELSFSSFMHVGAWTLDGLAIRKITQKYLRSTLIFFSLLFWISLRFCFSRNSLLF